MRTYFMLGVLYFKLFSHTLKSSIFNNLRVVPLTVSPIFISITYAAYDMQQIQTFSNRVFQNTSRKKSWKSDWRRKRKRNKTNIMLQLFLLFMKMLPTTILIPIQKRACTVCTVCMVRLQWLVVKCPWLVEVPESWPGKILVGVIQDQNMDLPHRRHNAENTDDMDDLPNILPF